MDSGRSEDVADLGGPSIGNERPCAAFVAYDLREKRRVMTSAWGKPTSIYELPGPIE